MNLQINPSRRYFKKYSHGKTDTNFSPFHRQPMNLPASLAPGSFLASLDIENLLFETGIGSAEANPGHGNFESIAGFA